MTTLENNTSIAPQRQLTKRQRLFIELSLLLIPFFFGAMFLIFTNNLWFVLFILSIPGLITVANLPKTYTAKELILIFIKSFLRLTQELLDFVRSFVPDLFVKIMSYMFVTFFMGILTLYLFTLPGGLIGAVANQLVIYSRSTGQGFTTVYAVFSTAIVIGILFSASMTKLVFDALNVWDTSEEKEQE